ESRSHRGGQGFRSPQLHPGQRPVPNMEPTLFDLGAAAKCSNRIKLRRAGPRAARSRASVRAAAPCQIRRSVDLRSEEHTSELQSLTNLVCRLLLEKKKKKTYPTNKSQPSCPHHL